MARRLRRLLPIAAVIAVALVMPAWGQVDSRTVDEELAAANRLLAVGRVQQAIDRLGNLLRTIDSAKDKDAYWRTGAAVVEILCQIESYSQAQQTLNLLLASNIFETRPTYFQWAQLYFGRTLAYQGKPKEAEKYLRALTADDARLVQTPAQRSAAIVLSDIELGRDNFRQAAIWMRRAVIGTLVDHGAASDEIIDVLARYASFLMRTRQLPEAYDLFMKLVPLYARQPSFHGPRYLFFASRYLRTLTESGDFRAAQIAYESLRDVAATVDLVGSSIKEELYFQELYQLARARALTGEGPIRERLKAAASSYPEFAKEPRTRVIFSFFALLADDVDLADQLLSAGDASARPDTQDAAHDLVLRSFIAARRDKSEESVALAKVALERIREFHQRYESESATRLPTITIEEREILSLIAGWNATRISTFGQADVLFQLMQFLNRDKGKLGLHARATRQALQSDRLREDIRMRDQLRELRDRTLGEATELLLARVLPIRDYSPDQNNDYGPLTRLEEIEGKIAVADADLAGLAPDFSKLSADGPVELRAVQRSIRAGEAMVLHGWAGGAGLVTTCITSNAWKFHVKKLDKSEIQRFFIDEKLLSAAVRGQHQPSAALDASFPSESAYRLYRELFGGIEPCLKDKSHILLATDPDLFSLPWNALLTKPPSDDQGFRHRDAAWLPRSYALSLLPSVRSLHQLRAMLPPSRARATFLGVGDPDFRGAPDSSTEVVLASLFVSRGVANREAVAALPRLPGSADELGIIAKALGARRSDILLGRDATEEALRKRPLNDYRVISFATHAVVAGEIDGATEPALVLSPGEDDRNESNDGLLTATEIANLTLDANLVILSACNTAASDGRAGGRGLSGLADAFFFAGARAVAVTQWAVFSDAAKELGAGLVSRPLKSQGGGVAEGLRQTMLDYVAAAKEDYLAHPRFWAAFVIAGDGAVKPLEGAAAGADGLSDRRPSWLKWLLRPFGGGE